MPLVDPWLILAMELLKRVVQALTPCEHVAMLIAEALNEGRERNQADHGVGAT